MYRFLVCNFWCRILREGPDIFKHLEFLNNYPKYTENTYSFQFLQLCTDSHIGRSRVVPPPLNEAQITQNYSKSAKREGIQDRVEWPIFMDKKF